MYEERCCRPPAQGAKGEQAAGVCGLGVDRSSVRYFFLHPDDADLRKAMIGVADERRRFDYRCVDVMLERQGCKAAQRN